MSKDNEKFHEYDGIIELDNPLPSWWLWTFLLAIIFAFIYFTHYVIAGGPTLEQELDVAMKELSTIQSQSSSNHVLETEDGLRALFAKEDLALGQAEFTARCAACHGAELQGVIGPNLTDEFWLHGDGSRLSLLKVIREGVPEKGMPPWENVLNREQAYALSAFILSKKGSRPAGAKAAQGTASEHFLDPNW